MGAKNIREWILNEIGIALKLIVIVVLGVVIAGVGVWYSDLRMRNDIDDIAKSLAIGGSPFLIQLPKDSSVTIKIGDGRCGYIGRISSMGQVSSLTHIGNQPVQISLNNGLLDLTPYIQSLKECNTVRITTRSLFEECYLYVRYADAKIIDMGTHCTQ